MIVWIHAGADIMDRQVMQGTRGRSYPTAAVRLRLPVARMMLVMSAATMVAPSLRISATRCASTLRIRLATECLSAGLVKTAFGLHNHRHRFRSRASA